MRERARELEDIELPAKLLDYFLRSNKSNINQYYLYAVCLAKNLRLVLFQGDISTAGGRRAGNFTVILAALRTTLKRSQLLGRVSVVAVVLNKNENKLESDT